MNGPANTGYDRARARMEMQARFEQEKLRRAINAASQMPTPIVAENDYRPQGWSAVMRIQGLAAGLLLSLPIWAVIGMAGKRFGIPHLALGVFFFLVAVVALVTIGRGVARAVQWMLER